MFLLAEERGDRIALIFEGERITFGQLAERVRATAAGLATLGVQKGSRVGIMMPSSPDFIVVQQALFMLGAVVSPLNIFYQPGEVAHVIQSCDLEFVALPTDLADRSPRGRADALPSLRSIILTDAADGPLEDRFVALRPVENAAVEIADVADDDVAMLLNTSATTGKSKGVMLTAANLAANYDSTPGWLGLDEDDVILCALPLYNTFGLNQCINAMLVTGATMVLLRRFEAKRCIDAIAKYHCTFLPAVPTMLQKIVDHEGLWRGALSSIDHVMTGGAPVPAALLRRVLDVMGDSTEVLTGYGLTEGTALVTLTAVRLGSDGEIAHGRTIGRVLEGMTLAIRGDDGRFLPTNEVGEIVVPTRQSRWPTAGSILATSDISTRMATRLSSIARRTSSFAAGKIFTLRISRRCSTSSRALPRLRSLEWRTMCSAKYRLPSSRCMAGAMFRRPICWVTARRSSRNTRCQRRSF